MKKGFQNIRNFVQDLNTRGDKNDVLPTEVLAAEKRVDLIKNACQLSEKRILGGFSSSNAGDTNTRERRLKKMPQFQLHQAFAEFSDQLGTSTVLGGTLKECSEVQNKISRDLLDHELEVEQLVIRPLNEVLETGIPAVTKARKSLNKATQDNENCRQKYQAALRASHQSSGPAVIAATNKAETLKKEWDEASQKVDQNKDIFASEVFSLLSQEPKISQVYLQYFQLQAAFHRQALEQIEEVLPRLQDIICNSSQMPVFGNPLEEHLRVSGREIALVIEACVSCLLHNLKEEGLFRIPGSASKVKKLRNGFDASIVDLQEQVRDPHSVAGTLKSYLRELPEPLFTHTLYDRWISAAKISDASARLQALWQVVHELPKENFVNLRYLVKFLDLIVKNSAHNKMTPQNLAIAMAPSLIWSPTGDEDSIGMNMTAANHHSVIVDSLVSNSDWFFPEEIEMTALPLSPFRERGHGSPTNGENNAKYTCIEDMPPGNKPAVRKAPRKPAPPAPAANHPASENKTINNNNVYLLDNSLKNEASVSKILPSKSNHFKSSAFANGSSTETLDSCGSRSPIFNGEIGSLDRRVGVRRNSSERRPVDRRSLAPRTSKLIEKPNIPPPSIPRRPNMPPPERPERPSSDLRRQKSAENLIENYSTKKTHESFNNSPLSKSYSVASEEVMETKGEDKGSNEFTRVERQPENFETQVTSGSCPSEDDSENSFKIQDVPVLKETNIQTIEELVMERESTSQVQKGSCHEPSQLMDENSETKQVDKSSSLSFENRNSVTSLDTLHSDNGTPPAERTPESDDSIGGSPPMEHKVTPRKPVPPPIKPRVTSLANSEGSRL